MSKTNQENDGDIKWDLCFLCQKQTQEKLTKPTCSGYDTMAKNIKQFHEIGKLPFNLCDSFVASENSLKITLTNNHASWHKSCSLKYSTMKLKREQLRVNKAAEESTSDSQTSAINTRSQQSTSYNSETCLFCDFPGTRTLPLRTVMKKTCNDAIIECANILKDYKVLGKVSERCDLIALEAKYHNKCLCEYRNKKIAAQNVDRNSITSTKQQVESITFAGLVAYINEAQHIFQNPVFNIADLAKLQTEAMKDLGVDYEVHTTRLKEKLLDQCPYLISCDKMGTTSPITFKNVIDIAIRSQAARNYDTEGNVLCNAAKIIRADLFDKNTENNTSSFPASLLALVSMILYGPSSPQSNDSENNMAIQCIAELISFHAVQKKTSTGSRNKQQVSDTCVPVYLAAKLYAGTRKRNLIDSTYHLGLSISYQRLQKIITEKANTVCKIYHDNNVVCPPKLQKGLFTTAAVDNIDHNPTSSVLNSAFHGTAITLMQHSFPGETGIPQNTNDKSSDNRCASSNKVSELPRDYSVVPPCFVDIKKSKCSQSEIYTHDVSASTQPLDAEEAWLQSTMSEEFKSWAAHHSESDRSIEERHKTDVVILPLFREQSHSPAMMLHAMNMVAKATTFINPEQIPVIVADQPLYTLLKQLQYLFPLKVGEDQFFIMMGGLHIEMAALRLIGQWLSGSGWTEALVQADVTTQGRSESMLVASNVTRTRYCHQVTAATLYCLQQKAYYTQIDKDTDVQGPSFHEWRTEKNKKIPQFKYWDLVLNLELTVFQFIGSTRKGDFNGYLDAIRRILPWFFALDHMNYSRWLSVHLRDLVNLEKTHPDLFAKFVNGQFVARKTDRSFSGMALDQAHEQMNAVLKGDGGVIGITENPDTLRKWLIAGPELTEMIKQFEKAQTDNLEWTTDNNRQHHSDNSASQLKFISDVKSLSETVQDLGNPFLEETLDLYNIDNKTIASAEVANTVWNIEECGEAQYLTFCKERLSTGKNIPDPIKLNKYALFSSSRKATVSKTKAKISGLKNDCSLFSKLYIATSEHRTGDLDSFFSHENQATPPSLSVMGKIRPGTKSDLLKCLCNYSDNATTPISPPVSVKVLDGPAVVHMLNPGHSNTFLDYAIMVFIPFICREFDTVSRVDLVWDSYDIDSLKNVTREKRGCGQRIRVTPKTKIPKGWSNFLRDASNKEELFSFLAHYSHQAEFADGKYFFVTDGPSVLTNSNNDHDLSPCNHEESDTRMMVHVADAVAQGHTKIMIRTVDTDVVVLAVACVSQLPQLAELWVHIGTGKNHQFLSCHAIANSLGPQKAQVLPLFHAFTGCDTVSFFGGKGKKSAFDAWSVYPDATTGLQYGLQGDVERALSVLETFVVFMYDKSGTCESVNECRKFLFTKKDRQLENMPPTKDALLEHLKRAVYQGGHVWGQILTPSQELPSPADWGWTRASGSWEPIWTTLPAAATACLELIKCRCKQRCAGRCNCLKRKLKCTELCGCGGDC